MLEYLYDILEQQALGLTRGNKIYSVQFFGIHFVGNCLLSLKRPSVSEVFR